MEVEVSLPNSVGSAVSSDAAHGQKGKRGKYSFIHSDKLFGNVFEAFLKVF